MRPLSSILAAFLLVLVLGHTHCIAEVSGSAGVVASSQGTSSSSCELCDSVCASEEICVAKVNGRSNPTTSTVPPVMLVLVGMPERTVTLVAPKIFARADKARPLYEIHSILLI